MPDETYYALLGWIVPRKRKLNLSPKTAQLLAFRLQSFLHDAGFELAKVGSTIEDGRAVLVIDEGRLSKVVFKGRSPVRTIQLKLMLDLPHQIYNRPFIERQLNMFRDTFGITDIRFDLVPVGKKNHTGLQVESLGMLQGAFTIPPPGNYELHITLGKNPWDVGFGVSLGFNASTGFKAGGSYSGRDVLLEDDRYQFSGEAAIRLFTSLDTNSDQLRLTSAAAEGRWFTPGLLGSSLRPFILGYGDLEGSQRQDLAIDGFMWFRTGLVLSLGYTFFDGFLLSGGFGFEHARLFGVDQIEAPDAPEINRFSATQWLANMRTEIVFDPELSRLDRRHQLFIRGNALFGGGQPERWRVRADYQRVFEFGWHDLWLRVNGVGMGGNVRFVDEDPIDDYVRGVFFDRFWIQRALALSLEFRYSVTRDLFKVSVYADSAAFRDPARNRPDAPPRGALGLGFGFHALVLDAIQVNLYYGFGFATDGSTDGGIHARLVKAF